MRQILTADGNEERCAHNSSCVGAHGHEPGSTHFHGFAVPILSLSLLSRDLLRMWARLMDARGLCRVSVRRRTKPARQQAGCGGEGWRSGGPAFREKGPLGGRWGGVSVNEGRGCRTVWRLGDDRREAPASVGAGGTLRRCGCGVRWRWGDPPGRAQRRPAGQAHKRSGSTWPRLSANQQG